MIKIEYEKTIDTIDDMLESDLPIMMPSDTPTFSFMESDPRKKIKALSEKVEFYALGVGTDLVWLDKG